MNKFTFEIVEQDVSQTLSVSPNFLPAIIHGPIMNNQGTLPICVGGLGFGSAAKLAPSAFLASAAATVALQNLMLPRDGIYVDNFRMQVYDMWRTTNGDVVALENPSQKHWIAPCLNRSVDRWLQLNGSTFDKTRIMAVKKPMGLIEKGAFRPDGYTITPWAQGRSLAWDVTLPHTMADRYIGYISVEAGTAALKASDFKNEKYIRFIKQFKQNISTHLH
ncbi:hypothetical protein HELRODRAFT_160643 [Helobdella robusta]|uniref:Uncharacterized protein n=1 Tax=Helobdella robusta TaxID=6412 RepID=T1EQJ6_HELRO|nr:hypothetical protein HELRODRAFT_160643 [Helobdella robusta]ESO06472.1 hypothetical protein HELRODRAFT_160643 [Helobdella robusta]